MQSDNDRYLQKLTCLSWSAAPKVARRAQAQAIRELVLGARHWAGWSAAAAWFKRTSATAAVESAG
jgi:hypothetical protein